MDCSETRRVSGEIDEVDEIWEEVQFAVAACEGEVSCSGMGVVEAGLQACWL